MFVQVYNVLNTLKPDDLNTNYYLSRFGLAYRIKKVKERLYLNIK